MKLSEKVTDYANKIVSSIKENKLDDAKRYFRSYFHISKFYRNPDYQNVPNGVVADIVEDICTKIASSTVENNETRVNNVIEEVLKEYFGCLISKDKSTGLSIGESVYDRVERWDRTCGYGNGSDMLNWGYVSNFIYDKLYNNTIGNSIITDVTNLFKNSGYNPDKDTFNSKINQILPYILINNNRYANYADTVRSGIYDRIKQLSGKGTNLDPGNDVLPIYRDWASSAFSSQSWRINYAEVLWPNVLAATFYCTRIPTINESRKEIIRNYINSRGSEEDKKGLLRQSLINIYTDSDGALNCLISISGYNLDWTARNESGAWYSDGFKHRPAEYEADGTTLKSEQGISTIGGTYLEVKKALDEIDKSATYTALGDAVKNTRVGALTTGDVLNETQATGVLTDNPDLAEPEDVKNAIYSALTTNISDSAVQEGFTKMYRGRQLGTHIISGDTQSDVRNSVDSQIAAGITKYLGRDMILSDYQKSALVTAVDAAVGASLEDQQNAIANYLRFSTSKVADIAALINEIKEGKTSE